MLLISPVSSYDNTSIQPVPFCSHNGLTIETKKKIASSSHSHWGRVDTPLKHIDHLAKGGICTSRCLLDPAFNGNNLIDRLETTRTGLRLMMSVSSLQQDKLSLSIPNISEITAVKVRDFSRNLLGVVTLFGAPMILLQKGIGAIRPQLDGMSMAINAYSGGAHFTRLCGLSNQGLSLYTNIFKKYAIPRTIQFLRVATFLASLEVLEKLFKKEHVTVKDLAIHTFEILNAGIDFALVAIKILGLCTGMRLYLEVGSLSITTGLIIYNLTGGVKPEKKLNTQAIKQYLVEVYGNTLSVPTRVGQALEKVRNYGWNPLYLKTSYVSA